MKIKELSALTDQELLQESKKIKTSSIINAVFTGVLIGIVIYSILKNSLGFLMLIPLFFAFKLINSSREHRKAVEKLLKDRKLG